jgi:hypothetical protein
MIYREGTIPKSKNQLRDQIGVAILSVPKNRFSCSPVDGNPYWDVDGIFFSIRAGVENLRKHLGDAKANQLLEMLAQAKTHYEAGENRLGGPLLQDTQMVLMGRQPWAYPKALYRWEVDSSLPEIADIDLLNRDDQDI